jgi:hypothetical protein
MLRPTSTGRCCCRGLRGLGAVGVAQQRGGSRWGGRVVGRGALAAGARWPGTAMQNVAKRPGEGDLRHLSISQMCFLQLLPVAGHHRTFCIRICKWTVVLWRIWVSVE